MRATVADFRVRRREAAHVETVRHERLELGHIGGKDRNRAGRQLLEELRLGASDVFEAPELLEVDGRDRRDQADVRPPDASEFADLTSAAHGHLRDDHLRLRLDAAERERQADLVVEAVLRSDGAEVRTYECGEDVLRRRLPD